MYWIDPLSDPRWAQLEHHPQASLFHTTSWVKALHRTYRYRPVALTSCPPDAELTDGIPLCEVRSWISGSRLVSLPFSDHCQPLLNAPSDLPNFISCLKEQRTQLGWSYIELRPIAISRTLAEGQMRSREYNHTSESASTLKIYREYNFHELNLQPSLRTIFDGFHKSCIQRKIQRAQRESLEYEVGRSDSNLESFYELLLLTRRRHRLPPQPPLWFRNLRDLFGERLTIRVASTNGRPIGGILTLRHNKTSYYKYGCSNSMYHHLGAMPMLFWRAIEEEKYQGAERFDLGRSDLENRGLSVFKLHLGATCFQMSYFRLGSRNPDLSAGSSAYLVRKVFGRMPGRLAQFAGSLLYRHMG
jgi:hypothetical protein